MKYRTMRFIGGEENVSLLGLGCMRFPLNEDGTIDEAQAEAMIGRALNAGINYIDTAYPYHKGESEPFLGRALKKYPRNSFYLATKLPVWLVNSVEDAERLFKEQLSRFQTKYIDYYLLHALDAGRWEKLVKEGIIEWAEAKKASGKIRHLGFSFHDTYPVFREILTYRQWDFCQIQYNYIDTQVQAGDKGYELAAKMGVPMVIMQGRVHYYEGYPMSDVVLPTRLMGLLGAKKIILTNAAGGVNYNFKPGDFMLITDHITTAVPNPLIGENIDELGTRFPDMSEVYAPELQEKVRKAAEKLQVPLQEGVYMQFTGPSYETPAEIRMCRTWGGDAAGMSTACEAVAANHMGMKVCGISCITNLAAGMSKQKLDHKEVQETADRVSRQFKQLVTEVIKTI